MAVHHRSPYSKYKLTTGMLGIVSDSVVRRQKKSEHYKEGVKNLFTSICIAFANIEKKK